MKKQVLFVLLLLINSYVSAQIDSLALKKDGRFKVAGRVIKNGFLSIPGDFSEMGRTFSNDWNRAAIYTGSVLGLIAVDKITTGYLHDKIEPTIDYKLPKLNFIDTDIIWLKGNNLYMTYPIMGLYAGSFALNHEKGQHVAINAFKAMSYSYIISHLILKTAFARNRPQRRLNDDMPSKEGWTRDNWDFGNFHPVYFGSEVKGTGMPSYHATTYFAIAKVFQMEYNNYWIPYTFATAVFFADLKDHNHWVSDLVAGGLIGTIIGRSVVKSSQNSRSNSSSIKLGQRTYKMNNMLIPQVSNTAVGLHFMSTF